jgi:beta-lactamase class D
VRYCLPIFLSLFFFSCTPNNVTENNSLGKFFKEANVEGTFALKDNGNGQFTVYNLSRYRDSSYLPASTFKIINSLIGLQTGKISSDSMVIKWDGIVRQVPEWNHDLTMYQAFRVSSVPYYQEVARRIGKDTMQLYLDSLFDHTKKITSNIDTFWLDNSFKLTPDQQLGLVTNLYFDKLPFNKYNQEIVKRAMLFEDNTAYKLSYKTGLGKKENGDPLAWVVGWIEENRKPYFFVLNIESKDPRADLKSVRISILKNILKELHFMEGKQ